MNEQGKRVLILGASYGGLYCAWFLHDLARKSSAPRPKITIIDRKNYVLYHAFLAECVSNQVNPLSIAPSIRRIIGKRDIEFVQAEITEIDAANKRAVTDCGTFEGDVLVLALGGVTGYFGNKDFEKYGYPCKEMEDSLRLRNHIIECMERADRSRDQEERRRLLTFVQAGAGATGLEVLTEVGDYVRKVCGKYYKSLNFRRDIRLILAEGMDRVLCTMEPDMSRAADSKLQRLGIEVRCGTLVSGAGPGYVDLKSGGEVKRIATETLIWVTGIKASPLIAGLPTEHDRMGRVVVDKLFQVSGFSDVYAVGDNAHVPDESGNPLGTTAQVAVQAGPALARNLLAKWEGREMTPFKYWNRGEMVSIGSLDAVSTPFGHKVNGPLAWMMYKYVHFSKMPTWHSRLRTLSDWLLNWTSGPNISTLDYKGWMQDKKERHESAMQ
ncbi:MAG: NAD(P)/FAD-dependent oxidoreductase [Anaerolineae bacterium]|nr:NAD(P)/FAD-dependent oxidoreductase [Anaerolineae bacterium]